MVYRVLQDNTNIFSKGFGESSAMKEGLIAEIVSLLVVPVMAIIPVFPVAKWLRNDRSCRLRLHLQLSSQYRDFLLL